MMDYSTDHRLTEDEIKTARAIASGMMDDTEPSNEQRAGALFDRALDELEDLRLATKMPTVFSDADERLPTAMMACVVTIANALYARLDPAVVLQRLTLKQGVPIPWDEALTTLVSGAATIAVMFGQSEEDVARRLVNAMAILGASIDSTKECWDRAAQLAMEISADDLRDDEEILAAARAVLGDDQEPS